MLMKKSALQVMAALILFAVPGAMACPLCANSLQLTISAQELIYAEHSVLALPVDDSKEFKVVAVIKGDAPAGNAIASDAVFRGAMKSDKPLLLVRDNDWRQWVNFGPVSADQAGWLRKLSTTKRTIEMNDVEWRDHVAYFLPYLENSEPLVAEIAFNEFTSAPYAALRSLSARLDVTAIRSWLNDPKLAKRHPVYLLLFGIAGSAQDAKWLEDRIASARTTARSTNLSALLGAYIELRGLAGIEQVEKLYLTDSARTKQEIEAALVALKVHGETDSAERDRVNEAFKSFVRHNPSLAGLATAGLDSEIKIAPVSAAP
jgi:hypothetical protein